MPSSTDDRPITESKSNEDLLVSDASTEELQGTVAQNAPIISCVLPSLSLLLGYASDSHITAPAASFSGMQFVLFSFFLGSDSRRSNEEKKQWMSTRFCGSYRIISISFPGSSDSSSFKYALLFPLLSWVSKVALTGNH